MTDLMDAVDRLTLPQRFKQMQDTEVVTVELPPLLMQLDAAIRSDIGLTVSGASLAHERNLLDADALHKFMQISSQIKDWCRMVKLVPSRDPVTDLRRWYVKGMLTLDEAGQSFYTRMLTGWANLIRSKLDPERERELPGCCPVCESGEWWRDGVRFVHPLVVRYRVGDDLVDKARGFCRACEQVWSARELSYAIEQKQSGA